MLTPETVASLGNLWSDDGTAVSFYFSEPHPDSLAHKTTLIYAKDRVLEMLHAKHPTKPALRNAMLDLAAQLEERARRFHASHPLAVAIFAVPEPKFWQELELPFKVSPTSHIGNSFLMAPLLPAAVKASRYFALLLDRSITRLFYLEGDLISDRTMEFGEERFPVRETGTGRSSTDERHKDKPAFEHLREVGQRIFQWLERGDADFLYIGCRNELYPEIKAAVPSTLLQKTVGQFHCDPALIPMREVQMLVEPLIAERSENEVRNLADEIVGEAKAGRLGAVGPQEVVNALELGEILTLLVGPHSPAPATACPRCGHMELGTKAICSICGSPNHAFEDLVEICARHAIKGSFNVREAIGTGLTVGDGYLARLRFRVPITKTELAS